MITNMDDFVPSQSVTQAKLLQSIENYPTNLLLIKCKYSMSH
jgi:hypothetical protein